MVGTETKSDPRRQNLLRQLASLMQVDGSENQPSPSLPATGSVVKAAAAAIPDAVDTSIPAIPLPPQLHSTQPTAATEKAIECAASGPTAFIPIAPNEFSKLNLSESEVESLVLKFLMHGQNATGRDVARQVGISFVIVEKLLYAMKNERLVVFKAAGNLGDYVYELTEAGGNKARKYSQQCGYFGAAPVSLNDYSASVAAQSLQNFQPRIDDLRRAFADLELSEEMFLRLGRAMVSGKGLFLHGPPGNGKTSIAERVTLAYGTSIWIPKAISAWGEIIRVFDPCCHEAIPLPQGQESIDDEKIDHRWVRIRRPTIVVGGELNLDHLEITANRGTGIAEAPLQLKSNCGTLVIDDFGRQQVSPAALLNRWIVPLEKRYDFLNLNSGRKIQVPFDQFIIFSTNLEPKDLVDEAFLRRIPYKIDVCGPTEAQFRTLFLELASAMKIEPCKPPLDYLIQKYYKSTGRAMRFCHPRDLLQQVKVYYDFLGQPAKISVESLDAAATDYFAVL